jgi:flagellar hook-associated protein 3 FlgL
MHINGGSDLARMQTLKGRAIATRDALDRAGLEFSTHQKASRYEATGGNLTRLFALERSLDRNAVFSETIALTELRIDTMQASFGLIAEPAGELGLKLADATGLGDAASALFHAGTARREFAAVIGTLNTQVAGQALFAGTATDSPAVAPADTILADLDALAGGAATAADAITAIEAYFAPPAGGFFATGYLGTTDDLAAVEIGEGERLDFAVRADAEELVAVLQAHALAAVVAGGAFAGDQAAQLGLLAEAGRQLTAAKDGMLELRGQVGMAQEAVEQARAARTAERDTLDLARSKLVGVDPLEAASRFQALEAQLEAIYTVTARIGSLRFMNFMR